MTLPRLVIARPSLQFSDEYIAWIVIAIRQHQRRRRIIDARCVARRHRAFGESML